MMLCMATKRRKHPVLSDETLGLIAARFAALSDPARLRLLNTLMAGELSVSELVERTGLEQSNVSRHLAVLRREGIVVRRAEGNRAFYRILDETVVEVCDVVCAGLIDQLEGDLDGLEDARRWLGADI
jgi:DNA-binding transcriptional ArsR family regulator